MTNDDRFGPEAPAGLMAHYTTAEAAFEHILPEERLRMSPYADMRDPIENKGRHPRHGLVR